MAEKAKTKAKEKNEVAVKEEQSLDLASIEQYDLAALDFDATDLDDLSGLESINASDIRVPYGKLYNKDQDGYAKGDIVLPDGTVYHGKDGDVVENLSILKIQPVRVYFPEKYNPKNSFICRSLDGKVGAEDGEFAGRSCSGCEFAQYPEEGGSSPCREQLLLLCTLPEGDLFYLLVSGIGVSQFKKQFMSVEMMKGLRLVTKQLKRSILGALNISLSVEMEETDYGPFAKPVFKVNREKPLVDMKRLTLNLEAYKSYKEFEDEAVATAATFAKTEQGEHDSDEGENKDMF